MNQHELKKAFLEGKRVYGTLICSPSPQWAAQIDKTGADFVFIDLEHMPLDPSARGWMCRCYSSMNLAPIVRIPYCSASEAFLALEAGAAGIMSPYVETMEEIETLIGAVKYRPLKGERLRKVLDGSIKLSQKELDFFKNYNDGHLLFLNIESRFAVENIDYLLSRPEIDGVFIGPHDLSINMGIPDEYSNPKFEQNIEKVINACRSRGIGIGNHYSGDIEKQIQWANKGMNIIIWNADLIRFIQTISNDFNYIKNTLGDASAEQEAAKNLSI